MMLWAYLDESGVHDPSSGHLRRLLVAGGISSSESWKALSVEWRAVLSASNIPMFHMKDFEARKGCFAQWPEERRRDLLNSLLDIALRYVPAFWGVADPPLAPGAQGLFKRSYITDAAKTVSEMGVLSSLTNLPITLILARHRDIRPSLMNRLCERTNVQFGAFDDPITCCPLQVADIVAYEFSRALRTNKPVRERYPLSRLKTARSGCLLANACILRYETL